MTNDGDYEVLTSIDYKDRLLFIPFLLLYYKYQ